MPRESAKQLYADDTGGQIISYQGTFPYMGRNWSIEILEVDSDLLSINESGLMWPGMLPRPDAALVWCVSNSLMAADLPLTIDLTASSTATPSE